MPDTGDNPATVVMVAEDGTEVRLERLDARRLDIAFIDALARLQLDARRRGGVLRIERPSDELRALLELVGLADVLGIQPRRQAEAGEQLRVEEMVQGPDATV